MKLAAPARCAHCRAWRERAFIKSKEGEAGIQEGKPRRWVVRR